MVLGSYEGGSGIRELGSWGGGGGVVVLES